jgi:hypothetical protein
MLLFLPLIYLTLLLRGLNSDVNASGDVEWLRVLWIMLTFFFNELGGFHEFRGCALMIEVREGHHFLESYNLLLQKRLGSPETADLLLSGSDFLGSGLRR